MRYPKLKTKGTRRQTVDVFRGCNRGARIGEGEFCDMRNLTSDAYPVLSPRRKRGIYGRPASPQGLIGKARLCYVDGADFVVGEQRVPMGLSVEEKDCPKGLTSMGAYVIILPDKKYINTLDLTDFGDIEAAFTTTAGVSFTLCSAAGEAYADPAVAPEPPANPANLSYWLDTSAVPHVLKQYSESTGMWATVPATYVKIASPGIGRAFRRYDGVTISGACVPELNGSHILWETGEDFILVAGILTAAVTQETPVSVERRMPNVDFLLESENRLWGCRYGTARDGAFVNEIYACKLGDFRNWNCFMGLSTDSYAASCGSDGPFTGTVAHLGYPLFFKENCIHKVYGSYPENFQIQTIACRGVQQGCHGSLAIVNETLFYKARSGICAFDGSVPVEVSAALGSESYFGAAGGAHGNKYYVSMADSQGTWHLFVYDTARGLWHREDNLHAAFFCPWAGELYCIDLGSRNILALLGSGEAAEEAVDWMAETGDLGLSLADRQYLSAITLRLSLEPGSRMDIWGQYDRSGEWAHLCHVRGTNLRSIYVPLRPRRCDTMKLRLEGTGGARVYSWTETIQQGSDIS